MRRNGLRKIEIWRDVSSQAFNTLVLPMQRNLAQSIAVKTKY